MITGTWLGRKTAAATLVCALLLSISAAMAAPSPPPTYGSPQQAVEALVSAMRAGGADQIEKALGPHSEDLVSSGDPVADKEALDRFIAAYDEKNAVLLESKSKALLMLGAQSWVFPVPIVKAGHAWRFDPSAGREEVLDRRIGRNELNAIEVCRTYVEAQNEYAHDDRFAKSLPEYAQKLMSAPGARDGLYWPETAGEAQSPFGPLVASARAEGYSANGADESAAKPYHGYLYRILTRQGKAAPGGAHDYVVDGHMIGGFALIAFPARYGDSGIMSFIVSHDGVVYQRDLGPDTVAAAKKISEFNPEKGWVKQ
jgi:hypothetical protein